mmetsp:Transcript_80/g.91  ORF Transcript_80/g.91 Transcript_80/m.91 type:complete len:104 (+) Transcript_80:32-343(+)|eukprot:CAMPEP_0117758710 /NCGR_PEP_ID=MMETSP0947-20121206/15562_1 /TAXON_ID=44440 /ORGANISM="Chattonella subsalsa, Strain CCMP2191" /LENGTH=103 /DNA_ID=CAMNT_0005578993 /DNA_START=32 /DNA_END=343 /DNA_ORIENTATION=+
MNLSDDEQPKKWVKLISAEDHEFYVDRKVAMVSGTINAMLSGQFAESRGEVRFREISSLILEKVIQYCYYKVRYTNSTTRIPEFPIEPEIALELLMAANFLDC